MKWDKVGISFKLKPDYKALTFREAVFYTAEEIRRTTDKNITLLVSGGVDSVLVSWVFRQVNIPVKRVHIRYFYKGEHINIYESRNIRDPEVICYDVDIEEYDRSQEYEELLQKLPVALHFALQTYYPDQDPETELLIRAGQTIPFVMSAGFPPGITPLWFQSIGSLTISYLYRAELVNFFQHNPIMVAASFTDNYLSETFKGLETDRDWELARKKMFYDHHFPELGDQNIQKETTAFCTGFKDLVVDRGRGVYKRFDGTIVDSYPQRTFFTMPLHKVQELCIKGQTTEHYVKWLY